MVILKNIIDINIITKKLVFKGDYMLQDTQSLFMNSVLIKRSQEQLVCKLPKKFDSTRFRFSNKLLLETSKINKLHPRCDVKQS